MGLKEDYLNLRFGNDAHERWLDDIVSNFDNRNSPDKKILTTDNFRLSPDITLGKYPELVSAFNRAIAGQPVVKEENIALIKALVGRDDLKVTYNDNGVNYYIIVPDEVTLSGTMTLSNFLGVAEKDLPPNLHTEFTNELLNHLTALHEAEHATQRRFDQEGYDNYINTNIVVGNIDNISSSSFESIKEADSDNVVLEHLDDMGYPHLKQTWLDIRTYQSFAYKLLSRRVHHSSEHDNSTLLANYKETGEVIDPDVFLDEKSDLLDKVQREVIGFTYGDIVSIAGEYPPLNTDQAKVVAEIAKNPEYQFKINCLPRTIMSAVNNLLERGDLEGVQKMEAENYIDSMNRFGYTPESINKPEVSFEVILRNVLENKLGLMPKGQDPESASNYIDHSVDNDVTLPPMFK